MPREQVEEYIEAIFDIAGERGSARTTEVAKLLNNVPSSVTEVFQKMARNGFVRYEPYKGAILTEAGLEIAKRIKRKHRLLEVFLKDSLGVNCKKIHEEACKMEHAISDDTCNALCRSLNAPARCPNGKWIYPCQKNLETCNECESVADDDKSAINRTIIPITDLRPSQKGNIAFLRGSRKSIQRLSDLGLIPKTEITLMRKIPMSGPIEVSIRRTPLAVGREIADNIFVGL